VHKAKVVASALRSALLSGITLEMVAKELGIMAVLNPIKELPLSRPLFDCQVGADMHRAYLDGIISVREFEKKENLTS
jgi:hypothetical protein